MANVGFAVGFLVMAISIPTVAVAGQCNDPWVTQAVTTYLHRAPASSQAVECNVKLYRNGHWASRDELFAAVDAYWSTHSLPASQPVVAPYRRQPNGPQIATHRDQYGRLVDSSGRVVAHDGGTMIGQDGASIQRRGGNVVSQGGGNVVSQGGGN